MSGLKKSLWPGYAEALRLKHRGDAIHLKGLELSPEVRRDATIDWHDYERFYVPEGGLKMARVLDAGAGEGETAKFFMEQGAASVVCIEPDPEKVGRLKVNTAKYGSRVEIHERKFSYAHLFIFGTDFAKIDVEGAEAELLELAELRFPLAVEIHSADLLRRFQAKFPYLRYDRVRLGSGLWMGKYP